MLNKKGVTHTDWAISMGIFIIYISFLIIFILPLLLKTQFDPSPLFNTMEENFLKPLEWTIVKIPLNLEKFENKLSQPTEDVRLSISIDNDHRFTTINPKSSSPLITFDESDQPTQPLDELNFIEDNKKMRLGCQTSCPNKILKYTIAPIKQKKVLYENTCNLDEEFCQFSLGTEEKIVGIKEKPFLNNQEESPSFLEYKEGQFSGYNTLKTDDLKFPESKDFDIKYIEDRDKNGVIDSNENQRRSIFDQSTFNQEQKPPPVPKNVNVFIKELKRSYVNEMGGLNPVIFYFEIW
ncbi:hypothetical protein HY498_01525 [Candidatus Woesearchaeota archaeon]|nr:hypothetical protein [Candidatus Woesearchaeota archaeon]